MAQLPARLTGHRRQRDRLVRSVLRQLHQALRQRRLQDRLHRDSRLLVQRVNTATNKNPIALDRFPRISQLYTASNATGGMPHGSVPRVISNFDLGCLGLDFSRLPCLTSSFPASTRGGHALLECHSHRMLSHWPNATQWCLQLNGVPAFTGCRPTTLAYLKQLNARYNKKLWLTEFSCGDHANGRPMEDHARYVSSLGLFRLVLSCILGVLLRMEVVTCAGWHSCSHQPRGRQTKGHLRTCRYSLHP